MKLALLETNFRKSLVFVLLLVIVAITYNYHEIVNYRPQSTHKWRQSDCASITKNYYQGGMKFFKPEVNNLTSKGGKSGLAYTSELPLFYYSVAFLYKVFGPNDIVYRLLNTLLFLLGLYYLFRLVLLVSNDFVWAALIPLLLFTSPVLVYYGNNFLTNSSALSFSIIAWYYFVKYLYGNSNKYLVVSIIIFFVAATFKVTAFFSYFAIGALLFLDAVGIKMKSPHKALFNNQWKYIALMSVLFFVIAAWIWFARTMNFKNECFYFSTVTFPIWDLDKEGIYRVLKSIETNWLSQYFSRSMYLFLFLITGFIVYNFKKLQHFIKWVLAILFIEIIAFIALQFWTFTDHDYYTIGMYIMPVLLMVVAIYIFKKHYSTPKREIWFKVLVTILLIVNILYARSEINLRYNSWRNDSAKFKDLYDIEPYLRQCGIKATDTVIAIPDGSHASLYYMNQKGWTEYIDAKFNKGNRYKYNSSEAKIKESITRGAKYLIVNGVENIYKKAHLQPFCTKLVGRHKNVLIFNLQASDTNFNAHKRELKATFYCNADSLSADGKFFVSGNNSFEYGKTQSSIEFLSGENSVKLNNENPYGMTFKMSNLEFGETLKVSVWRKSTIGEGALVLQINNESVSNAVASDTLENGWEYIETELFIKEEYVGEKLVVFAFNSKAIPVYFDDLKIEQYTSIIK